MQIHRCLLISAAIALLTLLPVTAGYAQDELHCVDSDQSAAQAATDAAVEAIHSFNRFARSDDSATIEAVEKWFGTTDPEPVLQTLSAVAAFAPSVSFKCVYANTGDMVVTQLNEATGQTILFDEIGSTFAYVYPTNLFVVHLLRVFFDRPETGQDSQLGTIVHEVSHFVLAGNTDDVAYGPLHALALAQSDPSAALRNADNYQYLIEDWLFGI
jgi:hypothetical protein